jgi:hypothetical protein
MPITDAARAYQFKPGQSGNPSGKPRRIYLDALEEGVTRADMVAIIKTAVTRAKQGDKSARQWISDYLWGKPETSVEIRGELTHDDGPQLHLLQILLTALEASNAKAQPPPFPSGTIIDALPGLEEPDS